jgi:hypothetical protein
MPRLYSVRGVYSYSEDIEYMFLRLSMPSCLGPKILEIAGLCTFKCFYKRYIYLNM